MIPEKLRQEHEDGKVVFFCGAGVSMPAGLPSFKRLVGAVLSELLPPKDDCQPGTMESLAWCAFCGGRYDEALDILENPRAGGYEPKQVREKVRDCLTQDSPPLDKHLILARLVDLDKESGRLVTTNFDPLFEEAAKKLRKQGNHPPAVHVAPTLPPAKPQTFRGLAYLHGKLDESPDDRQLVLTTTDFGTAYMVEGWALRFAIGLFRRYRVVFIGYRVEDPMMRYLVTALDAAREFEKPYAFAPYGDKNEQAEKLKWRLKGIEPLLYDEADGHRELWRALEKWAENYRRGLTGRRQKVARLGQFPPKDENDPVVREMAWELKDAEVARYFANLKDERRPHPGWIAPLQREGLLSLPVGQTDNGESIAAPLVSQRLTDHLALHDATFHLSRWIVECLDTPEAIDWALRGGGVLTAKLRWRIRVRLDEDQTEPRPALRKIWQVLADDGYAQMLSEKPQNALLLSIPRLAPDAVFAKQVFLRCLRPLPVFNANQDLKAIFENPRDEPKDPKCPSNRYRIEIELLGIQHRPEDVKRFRERAENWKKILASMADELTALLLEAMDWFREFDKAAPDRDITYSEYPSISPHEQNRSPPTWAQLIELTRDSYDALVAAGNQDAAGRLARRWRSLPYPVFRRLALYAATGSGTHDVKLGLEVLLEGPQPALWGIHTRRETLRFLRKRGKDIPKESLVCLIEKILEGPPLSPTPQVFSDGEWNEVRDQDIRLRLHKLIECGINLPSKAQEVYDRIQRDMPWEPGGDHSEEFVFFTSEARFFDPNEIAAPQNFADMPVQEFIRWAETQPGGYWERSRDWWRFVEEDVESAVNLLKAASSKEIWLIPPWYKILEVLKEKEEKQDKQGTVDDALKRKVAGLIIAMPAEKLADLDFPASQWLGEVRTKLGEKTRRALWREIWDASLMGEPPEGKLDFSNSINHAGGILGEILWKELADRIPIPKVSVGENPGFPEPLRSDFERIAENDQPAGKLARVKLAPHLIWLYRIAPDWTERAFFRRMDIDDEAFDPYLWEGYLWNPRCTADLLAACKFKRWFFKILRNIDRLQESVRDSVCNHAVTLFIHMAVPPGRGIDTKKAKEVLLSIGIEGLVKAARTLRNMLDGAGEKSGALWRNTIDPWFARVWPKRRQDRSPELSALLAQMAMESGDAFPQAVSAIEDILEPEKYNAALSILKKKKDIIDRYPDNALTLADKLFHDGSDRQYLSELLKCIAEAKPEMKEDDRFQWLAART